MIRGWMNHLCHLNHLPMVFIVLPNSLNPELEQSKQGEPLNPENAW